MLMYSVGRELGRAGGWWLVCNLPCLALQQEGFKGWGNS